MQTDPLSAFLATPYGFVIFFVVLWCAVCFLISFFTGWFALARRFKRQSDPYGEIRSAGPFFYTVCMRFWGQYSSVIRLTAAGDALYASVLLPFRIGHPPLRIPWDEIRFARTKFFFRSYLMLTLGNEEKIPMRIPLRMARNLGILDRCPE
ncbi:MAG: hypothetical protein P4L40_24595 [Terracidiphilus sp.]|nr:hypothetical protein [Terracidiphilus sp.]